MKTLSVVLVFLALAAAAQARDDQREEATRLLVQASQTSLTPRALGIPYVERGTFVFFNLANGSAQGTYHLQWADRDNHLEEIRQGDYRLMVIRKDGKAYRRESMNFTPVRVGQLRHILPPFLPRFDDTDIIRGLKDRKLNDVPARCIQFDTVRGTDRRSKELCLAKTDARVLSYRTEGRGRSFSYAWSAFETFHGTLLPRHVELSEGGKKIIAADFTFTELAALAPSAIVVPEGIEPVPVCAHSVPPALISSVDPKFPPGEMPMNGTVTVAARVGKEGSVRDAQIVQTMGAAYDAAALRAVREWKFSPALCDGQPRAVNTNVQVRFQGAGSVSPPARVPLPH